VCSLMIFFGLLWARPPLRRDSDSRNRPYGRRARKSALRLRPWSIHRGGCSEKSRDVRSGDILPCKESEPSEQESWESKQDDSPETGMGMGDRSSAGSGFHCDRKVSSSGFCRPLVGSLAWVRRASGTFTLGGSQC